MYFTVYYHKTRNLCQEVGSTSITTFGSWFGPMIESPHHKM